MKVSEISTSRRIARTVAVAFLALAVAACSGGSSSTSGSVPTTSSAPSATSSATSSASLPGTGASTSASPTATTTPTQQIHATKRGEPPVVIVRGFTYNDSGADLDLAAEMAKGLNSSSKGLVTGSSTHLVDSSTGNGFMVLRLAMSAKARAISDSRWNTLLAPMVASFAGAKSAKTVTVAGERMAFARGLEDGETQLAYAWLHGRVLTIIIAVGPTSPKTQVPEAVSLVTAHVAAQKG